VKLGEVDAALVYRTDVRAADGVEGVEFAESAQAINDYPVVALTDGATAAAFVAHVRSGPALAVLTDAGFQKP
jgi:molybdate transport system substrate-binding protein